MCNYFLKHNAQFSPFPVIFLFDNETKSERPLKKFIKAAKLEDRADELSSKNHLLIEPNCKLNLVSVPLPLGKDECELEDLFTSKTLSVIINGRTFLRKDEDPKKFFNKDIFSKYVYRNYRSIDFSGFKPLLDVLNELVR